MALIRCPKCKHEISDTTNKCIHCGARIREKKHSLKRKIILIIILIVLSITIAITIFINCNQTSNNIDTKQHEDNSQIKVETDNADDDEKHIKEDAQNHEIYSEKNNSDQQQSNDTNSASNNDQNNSIVTNKDSTNNTNSSSNNTANNNKIIIDATVNKSCPSGYELNNNFEFTNKACQKMDIVNGTITYYCLLNTQILEGDKCKSIYISNPVGGQCYNGATLNNGVCEKTTYVNASTRLNCPNGYSKYSDTQCYVWLYQSANITYSCPSGYKLKGNKCEK